MINRFPRILLKAFLVLAALWVLFILFEERQPEMPIINIDYAGVVAKGPQYYGLAADAGRIPGLARWLVEDMEIPPQRLVFAPVVPVEEVVFQEIRQRLNSLSPEIGLKQAASADDAVSGRIGPLGKNNLTPLFFGLNTAGSLLARWASSSDEFIYVDPLPLENNFDKQPAYLALAHLFKAFGGSELISAEATGSIDIMACRREKSAALWVVNKSKYRQSLTINIAHFPVPAARMNIYDTLAGISSLGMMQARGEELLFQVSIPEQSAYLFIVKPIN